MKYRLMFLCLLGICQVYGQNVDKLIAKGNSLYENGQYDAAEQQYRKALTLDPQNGTALYNLGNAMHKQKKFDEAIKTQEQLAESHVKTSLKAAAYYNEGVAYTQQKELEQSIDLYKKALRLNPSDQEARENLELALKEQKKQQEQKKNQQQNQQQSKMSQKEADQKLKLLSQREKDLQQRLQNQSKQSGSGQSLDW